ncbi:hypothetical protein OPW13_12540 [Vibrio europaeus]|uniref:hypothetical protein n=1 Tax=Vibrio oreintalis group TaxID=1891919 RepID=UPI0018E94FB0|nr:MULTISPECIES: hypothetical protein [Vibrio oreintalis group]MCG9584633.1 hypothetical protein [Vibrio tubiashii]MCG9618161.1 hypothetical protein [Vibrio tubiashii]MCG9687426.1 hypothetical protein [Vibrio tubiashii]MDC5704686.1 hypothetical protein [Vibrio europaeus]MDC5711600.1 hypothetical protein [Vibrio europaeus]
MPTEKGLAILESLKAQHFPKGYRSQRKGGKDYRYSRKGQAEFKRAAKLQAIKHRESIA